MPTKKTNYKVNCNGVMTRSGRKSFGSILSLTAAEAGKLKGLIVLAEDSVEPDESADKDSTVESDKDEPADSEPADDEEVASETKAVKTTITKTRRSSSSKK